MNKAINAARSRKALASRWHPGTPAVEQADLELRDAKAAALIDQLADVIGTARGLGDFPSARERLTALLRRDNGEVAS